MLVAITSRLGEDRIFGNHLSPHDRRRRVVTNRRRGRLLLGGPGIGWNNAHRHEKGMRIRPSQRLSFCFEKAIDHDRVLFGNGAAGFARGFSIFHGGSGIDGGESAAIRKNHFAAVRNVARIDRAMSAAQTQTGRGFVLAREVIGTFAAAGPVNRDTGKQGLLARKSERSRNQKCDYYDEPSHNVLR